MGEFEGAGVLVTGGTTGLGRAIAASFRDEGAAVVITGRDEGLGSAAAGALGATFVRADAAEADRWPRAWEPPSASWAGSTSW